MRQLTIKDVIFILDVKYSSAQKIYSDIKKHYGLKTKPTTWHFKDYMSLPHDLDLKLQL